MLLITHLVQHSQNGSDAELRVAISIKKKEEEKERKKSQYLKNQEISWFPLSLRNLTNWE